MFGTHVFTPMTKGPSARLVRDYGPAKVVTEDMDGALMCSCARFRKSSLAAGDHLGWCKHVQDAVYNHYDAPLNISYPLWVPIYPRADMWAQIDFSYDNPHEVPLPAHLLLGDLERASPDLDDFLGFVGQHEGRRAIKELIHEWLANLDPKYYWGLCEGVTHDSLGWRPIEGYNHDRYLPAFQQQTWSVLSTGYCLECRDLAVMP